MKTDTNTGCDTKAVPEAFKRFEDLARKIVSVPKQAIKDHEKKAAKSEPKKQRS